MEPAKVVELRLFVEQCQSNPSILNESSLGFFRSYLQSLGGRIPPEKKQMENSNDGVAEDNDHVHMKKASKDYGREDQTNASDNELEDIVKEDNDPPQKMGNPNGEVSDDQREAAQVCKAKALDALAQDKLEEAVEHLTEAILLNPVSAILLSTRASVYLKMKKANAALRDADAALQINPDSAKGYKARGMASAMLGQWEKAASDLHIASKLDYDEEIASILKKVEPNARKVEERRRVIEHSGKEDLHGASIKKRVHQDSDSSAFQEGTVVGIHEFKELEANMKAAAKLSRLVILYFTATWCGPCRFISPVYTNLASKYPKVVFLKIDIDDLSEVAHRWNVSSVPTFFFTKNGKEIDKVVGANKADLERKIQLHAKGA